MEMDNATFYSNSDVTTVSYTTFIDNSVDNSDGFNVLLSSQPNVKNISDDSLGGNLTWIYELQTNSPLFEAFAVTEIVMTALELVISIVAALKIPRWTKNYRNQMLMQLSLVRFLKRIVQYVVFLREKRVDDKSPNLNIVSFGAQTYFDIVTVILVVFFIKHMYDSLIVVIVRINQGSFLKMLCCAWLLPVPISAAFTGIVSSEALSEWWTYLLICSIFRWPLIIIGTALYITILYRVFTDKIRQFARSLTFTTFLICLIVNFYLVSKDVIELWCIKSFLTVFINHMSGFLLNLLVLCFYLILIIQNYKKKFKSTSITYSLGENNAAYEVKR